MLSQNPVSTDLASPSAFSYSVNTCRASDNQSRVSFIKTFTLLMMSCKWAWDPIAMPGKGLCHRNYGKECSSLFTTALTACTPQCWYTENIHVQMLQKGDTTCHQFGYKYEKPKFYFYCRIRYTTPSATLQETSVLLTAPEEVTNNKLWAEPLTRPTFRLLVTDGNQEYVFYAVDTMRLTSVRVSNTDWKPVDMLAKRDCDVQQKHEHKQTINIH